MQLAKSAEDKEKERYMFVRQYFEDGCLCIQSGKLKKRPEQELDQSAAEFYESNCVCTRNYLIE